MSKREYLLFQREKSAKSNIKIRKCGSDDWILVSVDPDTLLLRMGEFDLGDEYEEAYTFQVKDITHIQLIFARFCHKY